MLTTLFRVSLTSVVFATLVMSSYVKSPAAAGPVTLAKDQGPFHAKCDHLKAQRTVWLNCIGRPTETSSLPERFYAGYWLAKAGAYEAALRYLRVADQQDPRVATYIGFSLRKLGQLDRALPFYVKALALDPNYNVARAYLGEAHLTQGNLDAARSELSEIANRCGVHCAEYVDLAGHIKEFQSGQRSNG